MLKIKNLSKSFNNKKVLDNISFDVKNGEIAVFLGQSGVGKSTLLRILNNLESYEDGEIILNNKPLDLKKANEEHLIGMVFQQFNLFEHMTVERNITFVLEKSAKKNCHDAKLIAQDLLKKFGLLDKANLPVTELSGGQKQRLAIARTLSLKPQVVCLDEPTSALDPMLTGFVANNIEELRNQNYTVLVTTHDIALIERLECTIYLMDSGKIVESTLSQEYFAHPEQYPLIEKFVTGK